AVALARFAQIGDQRVEVPADLHLFRFGLHLGDVALDMAERDDRMPGARQPEAHRPSEPAQPAGYQRNPVFSIVSHASLPVPVAPPAPRAGGTGLRAHPAASRRGLSPRAGMISSAKVRSPAPEAPGAANSTFSPPPASSRFSRAMISSGVPSSGASSSSNAAV